MTDVFFDFFPGSLEEIIRFVTGSVACHTYTRAGLFYGSHRLVDAVDELADVLEVSGHLRGQHHVDNCLSQRPELIPVSGEGDRVKIWTRVVMSHTIGLLRCLNNTGCHRPVGVLEDVALAVSDGELEGEGGVVALQHGRVVVEDRQFAAGVAQEGVGPARVVHVMHCGRYQRRHLIQLVQTALNETAAHTERCQYLCTHSQFEQMYRSVFF